MKLAQLYLCKSAELIKTGIENKVWKVSDTDTPSIRWAEIIRSKHGIILIYYNSPVLGQGSYVGNHVTVTVGHVTAIVITHDLTVLEESQIISNANMYSVVKSV